MESIYIAGNFRTAWRPDDFAYSLWTRSGECLPNPLPSVELAGQTWTYTGPFFDGNHGGDYLVGHSSHHENIKRRCRTGIVKSNRMIAWVESQEDTGTLLEIGFYSGSWAAGCKTHRSPPYVVFATEEVRDLCWFCGMCANWTTTEKGEAAWDAINRSLAYWIEIESDNNREIEAKRHEHDLLDAMARGEWGFLYRQPEWQQFKAKVWTDGRHVRCVVCGTTGQMLDAHHKFYIQGMFPWEYETSDIELRCRQCHTRGAPRFNNRNEAIAAGLASPIELSEAV